MTVSNRALLGLPTLPFVDYQSYAGATLFLDLTFLDHFGALQTPTSIIWRADDITNAQNMVPSTSVTPTGSTQTLQIPGSVMQMSKSWQGSQLVQIYLTAVLPDTSVVPSITIVELCAIQLPT